jgi:dTDP-4-amino-4,6-dideoxygalactose transaminase
MLQIPPINLASQYRAYKAEIDSAILRVLARGNFILGEEVSAFEGEFSSYCGTTYGLGVASGTDALQLALLACNIGSDAEVITSAHTAVATVRAIELTGARPVLVDIDPITYTIDPERIESVITGKTRAIIPVHLYGCPADLDPIREIASQKHLLIIEDCAQAHGALYENRMVGSWGDLAAFSFYPTKNLGAYGDCGMVLTDRADLARRLSLLRQYGWEQRYVSQVKGINSRLDDIQAAVLRVKLTYLEQWNTRRRQIADLYNRTLADSKLTLPHEPEYANHIYHQYVIRTPERDKLMSFLKNRSIGVSIHYPVPIHLQPAFEDLGYKQGQFPETEMATAQILSLPIYPEMTDDQVCAVCDSITEFHSKNESMP